MLYCSWDMAWDRCNLYFSFSFYFSILLFWMSLGVCNHLNWPFDNGILKNVPLHLTFPFFHYAVFLMFKFLVVSDLCSETKGSRFESAARYVQRWALCSNTLSLPLQSCNLWVYVKENPDRKKKEVVCSNEIALFHMSIHPSLRFFMIGLLVFSDVVHDDNWSWYLVTGEAKLKKKIVAQIWAIFAIFSSLSLSFTVLYKNYKLYNRLEAFGS